MDIPRDYPFPDTAIAWSVAPSGCADAQRGATSGAEDSPQTAAVAPGEAELISVVERLNAFDMWMKSDEAEITKLRLNPIPPHPIRESLYDAFLAGIDAQHAFLIGRTAERVNERSGRRNARAEAPGEKGTENE